MAVNRKRLVLVTTKQPSSNPRLVKEAISLQNAGYEVTVIYNFWALWADEADKEIIRSNNNIHWQRVHGHPVESKQYYWYTRLRHKLYKILALKFADNIFFNERAESQFYQELVSAAKKVKAGLFIAHNLGALSVAAKSSKINQSKYAFDAEDYHRSMAADANEHLLTASLLEDRYLPGCTYVTAASPLIARVYKQDYPAINFTVINNFFSKQLQPVFKSIPLSPLRLFWFSQTTGLKRGLHDAVMAMNEINDFEIECTIVGDASKNVKEVLKGLLINPKHRLDFKQPCSEKELIEMSSTHHIGLALEPGFSLNNNIALSNKLFTYLLAGNAVILSATKAQEAFYKEYPSTGWLYRSGDISAFAGILKQCNSNAALMETKRKNAWRFAYTKLNWETESAKVIQLVEGAFK